MLRTIAAPSGPLFLVLSWLFWWGLLSSAVSAALEGSPLFWFLLRPPHISFLAWSALL